MLALNTGMRTSEILKLTRKDIALEQNTIRLPTSKSDEPHEIPMSPEVREAVDRCLARSDSQWLFYNAKTGKRLQTVVQPFKRACIRAGIPITDKKKGIHGFRVHDTRHTVASLLLQQGATLEEVQDLLNHADIRTTQRYAHHKKDARKRTISKLPKYT